MPTDGTTKVSIENITDVDTPRLSNDNDTDKNTILTFGINPDKDCDKSVTVTLTRTNAPSRTLALQLEPLPATPHPLLPCQDPLAFDLKTGGTLNVTGRLLSPDNALVRDLGKLGPDANNIYNAKIEIQSECGKILELTVNGIKYTYTIYPHIPAGATGWPRIYSLASMAIGICFGYFLALIDWKRLFSGGSRPSSDRSRSSISQRYADPALLPLFPSGLSPSLPSQQNRVGQAAAVYVAEREFNVFKQELQSVIVNALRENVESIKALIVAQAESQPNRFSAEDTVPRWIEGAAIEKDVGPATPIAVDQTPPLSFEEHYSRLAIKGENAEIPGVTNYAKVTFKDSEALAKAPSALQPLVQSNDGLLMVFFSEDLDRPFAYLAPSLELKAEWRNTQIQSWSYYFDCSSSEVHYLRKAAIVRKEGDKYVLHKKGEFA